MNLLIISPCFPPLNTPDHNRIRLSIPWFITMGHQVTVITVQPEFVEAPIDVILAKIPDPCRVIRIKALSTKWTRKIGLGNLGYRAWWHMLRAGNQLLNKEKYDLIYFSTTVFPIMTLGRIWKIKYRIPFILDFQDPWRNDFHLTQPKNKRPPKYRIAHLLDSLLEKWTVPHCDGIISVSMQYVNFFKERYKLNVPYEIVTFSSSKQDFEFAIKIGVTNRFFKPEENTINIVYIGVVPSPMLPVAEQLIKSLAYIDKQKSSTKNICIYFIGTSYDINARKDSLLKRLAEKYNLRNFHEFIDRISHFEVIKLLQDSDLVLIPGTLDAGYTASKIYNVILSQTPIFSLVHEKSSVAEILRGCNSGTIMTFKNIYSLYTMHEDINYELSKMIKYLPRKVQTDWDYYSQYSDKAMSEKQINLFSKIINRR